MSSGTALGAQGAGTDAVTSSKAAQGRLIVRALTVVMLGTACTGGSSPSDAVSGSRRLAAR